MPRIGQGSGNMSCHQNFREHVMPPCVTSEDPCDSDTPGQCKRSDLHLTSSYLSLRLCLLYLFRSDRQYLQTDNYVEYKFQLSSGHLHLCLNLHSVKHTSTAADKPIRPAVQYNHSFIWGRFIQTLVLPQHGSVREETVYSICEDRTMIKQSKA